ncbi:MAG: class I SAM-dependent methyltransferase [Micromonosporaceae bacterium]
MPPAQIAALRTPEGQAALASAGELVGGDRLAAVAALRAAGHPAEVVGAALTQAELRERAAAKFGADAARMFFTRDGLQQATRSPVAARRAARLAADPGVRRIADLCCGVGADTFAFARAGLSVIAVDADPETAAVVRANADALGLADRVEVVCGDAAELPLHDVDAVFCDPARRAGGRRVFDPRAYTPPWEFLVSLAERVPRTVLKLGPGIDHALIPAGVEAEWVSVAGEVVEAALWHGRYAEVPRRATLLPAADPVPAAGVAPGVELTGSGERVGEVGAVRAVLYDPDGAVVRAHLVAELADQLDATLLDPRIAYLSGDAVVPTPFARAYAVRDVLPFSVKRLRATLRERGVGRLTIKKRASALVPEELRRMLRLAGDAEATVVLTRIAGRPYTLLVDPV